MNLLRRTRLTAAQLLDRLDQTKVSSQFHLDIPYFAQWESPDLIAEFMSGQKAINQDPLWGNSGADSADEYQLWSPHCCGMACLKMIVAHSQHQTIPLIQLAKDCARFGGYTLPLEQTVGLQYKPFQVYAKQTFNMDVQVVRPLTIPRIIKGLNQGQYVMASVSPNIDIGQTGSINRGHLVLITGYNKHQRTITFHNPGSRSQQTRLNCQLSFDQFNRYFNYKGLILSPPSGQFRSS